MSQPLHDPIKTQESSVSHVADIVNYQAQRKDSSSFFSYGLKRRFNEIESEFLTWQRSVAATQQSEIKVVDFGCGDSSMLDALVESFPNAPISGTGIDSFRGSMPESKYHQQVKMLDCDLRQTPYAIQEQSIGFAIASAVLKHIPKYRPFLREVSRILMPGGRVVLLDPTPTVVRVGMLMQYFDRRYAPFIWSARRISSIVRQENLDLKIVKAKKYWLAPNQKMYDLGLENVVPSFLRNRIGLHQCVVLESTK